MIRMCRLAIDKVALPVAGGVLDQAEAFMAALEFYRSEVAWLTAEDVDGEG